MAILRSKLLQKPPDPSSVPSESDAQRWKRKAKDRKRELLLLKEDLKELEVRMKERRRKSDDSVRRRRVLDLNSEAEIEQLRTSVDFLVELCDSVSPVRVHYFGFLLLLTYRLSNIFLPILVSVFNVFQFFLQVGDTSFTNLSHQAVDFILDSLKNLLSTEKNIELIEGIVSSLITRLVKRMCTALRRDDLCDSGSDAHFYVQHLIRVLGSEPYIGQRTLLSVSQRISVIADSLLSMDPFDDAFPNMHSSMFMLMQLIEFLISQYIQTWSNDGGFEKKIKLAYEDKWKMTCDDDNAGLFEEWVRSVLQARKALEVLESRNGLYVLYMDRVTGELAKQVSQVSSLRTLDPDILDNLDWGGPVKQGIQPDTSKESWDTLVAVIVDEKTNNLGHPSHARRLGIHMKRMGRFGQRGRHRSLSAYRTPISSFHVYSVLASFILISFSQC
ncbi:hypothetical protein HHK36_025930 [Tetracentron sinense]|uniref:Uncharacterized protein n=1 Tax=Tetracentron sinense TaxID=13715 RepID=A0A835D617_TETSI|nr:hypothetical protein HHK36_025930 [Tetracentron sinense]